MFFESEILGDQLPPGTLCLTYDDGPGRPAHPRDPGPRTAELGAFLHAQGVPATFFAVGKFAQQSGEILAGLKAQGHLVANHTYDHPSLPAFVAQGGDAAGQLERTDRAIGGHGPGHTGYFRPPYGDWWLKGDGRSVVAAALNRSALAPRYIGPIGWDIDAGDVGFWRDGRAADDCADAYLGAIEAAGRGIVLLHDSTADIDELRPKNQALALARALVPELRRRGYRFVRLDAVAQVASAARVSSQLTLTAHDGRPVPARRVGSGAREIPADGPASDRPADTIWGVVRLSSDRWALRGAGGLYLSPRRGGEAVADALVLGAREVFTVEHLGGPRVAFRTIDGAYLTRPADAGDLLRADARSRGPREVFLAADPFGT